MPIWFKDYTLQEINKRGKKTLVEHLGIEITAVGDDYLEGIMPVDERTKQPAGLLHGGASAAFAETLASTASNMTVDTERNICVGLEINANHISSCTKGTVTGRAEPIHLGKTTQVWSIRISQADRLVCMSRMTLMILERSRAQK
jgi:1,4-dihydroxy-2-naphthoyl-CoA hydrolase